MFLCNNWVKSFSLPKTMGMALHATFQNLEEIQEYFQNQNATLSPPPQPQLGPLKPHENAGRAFVHSWPFPEIKAEKSRVLGSRLLGLFRPSVKRLGLWITQRLKATATAKTKWDPLWFPGLNRKYLPWAQLVGSYTAPSIRGHALLKGISLPWKLWPCHQLHKCQEIPL